MLAGNTAKAQSAGNTGEVIKLDKAGFLAKVYNFEKNPDKWVYEGSLPCVIDFYADWCGPCKVMSPVLKDLAAEYKGKMVVYQINVDNEQYLASAFGIRSIPTFFIIPAKGDPQRITGSMPRESFVNAIKEIIFKNEK